MKLRAQQCSREIHFFAIFDRQRGPNAAISPAEGARNMHSSQINCDFELGPSKHTKKENIMPNHDFAQRDLPQPTQPFDELNLASDMFHAVGLAAAAGIGTALASGFVVVMLALSVG